MLNISYHDVSQTRRAAHCVISARPGVSKHFRCVARDGLKQGRSGALHKNSPKCHRQQPTRQSQEVFGQGTTTVSDRASQKYVELNPVWTGS